jgi:hypothetical protein
LHLGEKLQVVRTQNPSKLRALQERKISQGSKLIIVLVEVVEEINSQVGFDEIIVIDVN